MLGLSDTSLSFDIPSHERPKGQPFQPPFPTVSTTQRDLEQLSLDGQVREIPLDDQVHRGPSPFFYENCAHSEYIISLCGEDEFFDTDAVLEGEAEYERRRLEGELAGFGFDYGFGQDICMEGEDVAPTRPALGPVQYSQDDDDDYNYDYEYDYAYESDSGHGYVFKDDNDSADDEDDEYDDIGIGDEEQEQEPESKNGVEYGADVECPRPCSQQFEVRSAVESFPRVDGTHVRRWRSAIYHYDEELMYDERYLILGEDDIATILNSVDDDGDYDYDGDDDDDDDDDDSDCDMQVIQM